MDTRHPPEKNSEKFIFSLTFYRKFAIINSGEKMRPNQTNPNKQFIDRNAQDTSVLSGHGLVPSEEGKKMKLTVNDYVFGDKVSVSLGWWMRIKIWYPIKSRILWRIPMPTRQAALRGTLIHKMIELNRKGVK